MPAGVTSVSFEATGGNGGISPGAIPTGPGGVYTLGGSGADIIGTFPVTPGQVLTIAVGGNGGTGAGGWGDCGMSGGPANTAKPKGRTAGAGGGATLIALANADGSNWHEMVVAGGGGGQGGAAGDPADAGTVETAAARGSRWSATRRRATYEVPAPPPPPAEMRLAPPPAVPPLTPPRMRISRLRDAEDHGSTWVCRMWPSNLVLQTPRNCLDICLDRTVYQQKAGYSNLASGGSNTTPATKDGSRISGHMVPGNTGLSASELRVCARLMHDPRQRCSRAVLLVHSSPAPDLGLFAVVTPAPSVQ